jgi:hypothetical protein
MISRGIHRSRSEKQGGQLQELGQRLRALAAREASVKAEAYAMLEIVTDVVEHLDDAGDEMATAFGAYQLGRRSRYLSLVRMADCSRSHYSIDTNTYAPTLVDTARRQGSNHRNAVGFKDLFPPQPKANC